MAVPATFLRRYAAYSVDVAIVLVIAVPLVAWQLHAVPAAFDAAVATLQQRLFELLDGVLVQRIHRAEADQFLRVLRHVSGHVLVGHEHADVAGPEAEDDGLVDRCHGGPVRVEIDRDLERRVVRRDPRVLDEGV